MRAHDIPVHERIDSLATRVVAVEAWMEAFKMQMINVGNEVKANTVLTEQTQGRTEEIYEFLAPARNFFRALGGMADLGLRVGRMVVSATEFAGRMAKPLFWIAAITAAVWAWWKTGIFGMPDWWGWFVR